MPFSRLVALAFVGLFAVVNVAAVPLPMDHAVARRDPSPFNPIVGYLKRDTIPEEVPTKAPDGHIVVYKRQIPE